MLDEYCEEMNILNECELGMVVYTCNPSYLGGGRRIDCFRLAQARLVQNPVSKKKKKKKK
jgi:hypothetical protein